MILSSEKAEGELVGHVIILGITVLGVSMISLYGIPAIYSLQDIANVKNVEQTFTVLDSQASRAVMGESPLQITNINLGGGSLTVEPNSTSPSYIMVNSTIFNLTIPMGKIEYQLGNRIVAYEGGGVWSKYPSGTVMLSRPELHYNGVTLTLPVFNISGNDSVGGRGTASVSVKKPAIQVLFPSPNWINRTNPVNFTQVGKVYVTIKSDFYDAWADHIGTLSSAKVVSKDATNSTARIELTVYPAYIGRSDSSIANPIAFRGLDGSDSTPLNNFSLTIKGIDSSFQWDIRAKSASENKRLIFDLNRESCGGGGDCLTIKVGYQQGSGLGTAETWIGDRLLPVQGNYSEVDLLNKSINLTYESNGVGTVNSCSDVAQIAQGDFNDTGFSWTDRVVNITSPYNKQSLYNITQHYIQLMAQDSDFSLYQCSPAGRHGPDPISTMYINYYAPGGLTYLHITDNRADIKIS